MSRIIRLEAENVKRLRAVAVRPDGAVVLVGGNNGEGKTSLLDSIELALGGQGVAPPKVVRDGTAGARVVLELDDLVVERRWNQEGKSTLEVRSKDGGPLRSPQGILDKLVGPLSFDPLAFMREPAKRQAEILRKLTGLDFRELDAKRQQLYDTRRVANVEQRKLEEALEVTPHVPAPGAEVSLQDLLAEQQMMISVRAANEQARAASRLAVNHMAQCQGYARSAQDEVARLEAALAQARARLATQEEALEVAKDKLRESADQLTRLEDPDLAPLEKQIREAEAVNAKVRALAASWKAREDLAKRAAAAKERAEEVDGQLAAVEQEREELLRAAKMPVEGLGFGGEGVTYRELPLEQASSAEQLRVALAMGIAMNPQLRVILIRDGSLLDENSLRLVEEQAEAAGAQVWIEVVGTERAVGVLIEDGSASGPESEPVTEGAFPDA